MGNGQVAGQQSAGVGPGQAEPEKAQQPAQDSEGGSAGVHQIRAEVARGTLTPEAAAAILKANPNDTSHIIGVLQQTFGNGFVQHVLAKNTPKTDTEPSPNALEGIGADGPGLGSPLPEGQIMSADTGTRTPPAHTSPPLHAPGPPGLVPGQTGTPVGPQGHAVAPVVATTHTATPAPGATWPMPKHSDFVMKPDTPVTFDPLANAKNLHGDLLSSQAETTEAEAKVLNTVRHADQRFNAKVLAEAQGKLGVTNASGAFNTETLRKLRDKDPHIGAAEVLLANTWVKHTGLDPIAGVVPVDGRDKNAADSNSNSYADHAAQALGSKSYADYSSHLHEFSFLGVKPQKGKDKVHEHLAARLKAAEAFLINKTGLPAEQIPAKIGWQKGLVGYYDHEEADHHSPYKTHMHTLGLAVDFDPSINPFLYPESDEKAQGGAKFGLNNADQFKQYWTIVMDVAFAQAAELFQAVKLDQPSMLEWSEKLSTEELHARVKSASDAIEKYMTLAKTVPAATVTRLVAASKQGASMEDIYREPTVRAVIDKYVAAGYSEEQAKKALPEMLTFPDKFHNNFGRQNATNATTHSLDLTVALRDAGGLAWGGSEMSHGGDNGDFMHFDCRQDAVGAQAKAYLDTMRNDTTAQTEATEWAADQKAKSEKPKP